MRVVNDVVIFEESDTELFTHELRVVFSQSGIQTTFEAFLSNAVNHVISALVIQGVRNSTKAINDAIESKPLPAQVNTAVILEELAVLPGAAVVPASGAAANNFPR